MTSLLLTVSAAAVAILAEYLYRVLPGPWVHHLWLWIPMQLFIGYAVCQLVRAPNTPLIGAFITWSVTTLVMRVAVTVFLLRDHVSVGTWVAVGLLVLAKIAQQVWK